ncbi:MAG TPA: aldehyde dehydrogenase family protein, partial [Stellaceae bacterium]|nr:aldehyde dehydrogenase family protein [Stellaceae bacterium]
MTDYRKFYIDGAWVDPIRPRGLDIINPATEEKAATISMGSAEDVDRAVKAAQAAFPAYARMSREDRLTLLQKIIGVYKTRFDDIARAITLEMGAPAWLSKRAQAATGLAHLNQIVTVLKDFAFETVRGTTLIAKEPIGVCGFITPWNWPMNQVMCKVAPALAAGCTIVLKPSELAPLDAMILAEIFHEAGLPKGVFNLVNGDGAAVGQAIASHPGI